MLDEPLAILLHIFIIVIHTLGGHHLLAILIAYQYHLAISYTLGCITLYLHSLLTIDMINDVEESEIGAKGIADVFTTNKAGYFLVA